MRMSRVKPWRRWRLTSILALALVPLLGCPGVAVEMRQVEEVFLHEATGFRPEQARLHVGLDGRLYLFHNKCLLRMSPDGSGKVARPLHYMIAGVNNNAASGLAANGRGEYAVGEVHFAHAAAIFAPTGQRLSAFGDFDNSNYDAPQALAAGASGAFYALDGRRSRIVRLDAAGRVTATYRARGFAAFLVSEANQFFLRDGPSAVGFDGEPLWTSAFRGPCALDQDGQVLVLTADGLLHILGSDGKAKKTVALAPGEPPLIFPAVTDIGVVGAELIVKTPSPTELFRRYDLGTGKLLSRVLAEHDAIRAEFPATPWEAGTTVPFRVEFSSSSGHHPRWHFWARPVGSLRWQEYPWRDQAVTVPADAAGFYQVRLSADSTGAVGVLGLDAFVEIRPAQVRGSIAAWTPRNRLFWSRGEAIPVFLETRSPAKEPGTTRLRLWRGGQTVAEATVVPAGNGQPSLIIPAALTRALTPGDYLLLPETPGLAGVGQPLLLGPDEPMPQALQFIQYVDICGAERRFVQGTSWDVVDQAFGQAWTARTLGLNLMAGRFGVGMNWESPEALAPLASLRQLAAADPVAPAVAKLDIEPPVAQTLAALGAAGVGYMPLLLGNDASVVLGTGYDKRTPEQLSQEVADRSKEMLDYPAFRGWCWAANWWGGLDASRPGFADARKNAAANGTWSPVLQDATEAMLEHAPHATELLNAVLHAAAPGKLSAVAAPYRNACAWPPLTFRNVDVVDLHYQPEQMIMPYYGAHAAEFYRRPGKPAWGHPVLYSDDGTGGQILATNGQLLLRGANGIGLDGAIMGWAGGGRDPRSRAAGLSSVYRQLFGQLRPYGPWLGTLEAHDTVAIIASDRQFRLDDWDNVWPRHFARIKEAFVSCLHAHLPAQIVLSDDMQEDSLTRFQAVLLVGMTVEPTPQVRAALAKAKAAGVKLFHDQTCRASLVEGTEALPLGFDHFANDPITWGDDPAFSPLRLPGYAMANAKILQDTLGKAVTPVANLDAPEVLLSERVSGEGRFLFAVNNSTPDWDPGLAWRHSLIVTTRLPLVVSITPSVSAAAIYDVFARRPAVRGDGGAILADFRGQPFRIFALLPAPLGAVELTSPETVAPGQPFACSVRVLDDQGRPVPAAVPVRLRLVPNAGEPLADLALATQPGGKVSANLCAPLLAGDRLFLEATEMLSGLSVQRPLKLQASATVADLAKWQAPPPAAPGPPVRSTKRGDEAVTAFGPHLKEAVVSADGKTACVVGADLHENCFGLDTATGRVTWQRRLGHTFAYQPQANAVGFAVQAVDLLSSEGEHAYTLAVDGTVQRRFAAWGFSHRNCGRVTPGPDTPLKTFAVAPDGVWLVVGGELGTVVWSADGKELARLPGNPALATLDGNTVLAVDGGQAVAYEARTGKTAWKTTLAPDGEPLRIRVTPDGKRVAVLLSANGGFFAVLEAGKIIRTFPVQAEDMDFSADGEKLAAVAGSHVSWLSVKDGLTGSYSAPETLYQPRFSPDSSRFVCAGNLGRVYVFDAQTGGLVLTFDAGALAAPAWLPGGDLLLVTWSGEALRLRMDGTTAWRTRIEPATRDPRRTLLATDTTPTARVTSHFNGTAEAPALAPNLLASDDAKTRVQFRGKYLNAPAGWRQGKVGGAAPPLIGWGELNWEGEGFPECWIEMEIPGKHCRVTALAVYEDKGFPGSWLRDTRLDVWDVEKERWQPGPTLYAETASHVHVLPAPLEGSRFRLLLPRGLAGNLRLTGLALHGDVIGSGHPDVAAKRPVAILLDETEEDFAAFGQGAMKVGDAFRGDRCLRVGIQGCEASPACWDFPLAEKPEPGQYRLLRFAWRPAALTPCELRILVNGKAIFSTQASPLDGLDIEKKTAAENDDSSLDLADAPVKPTTKDPDFTRWREVTVDLWPLLGPGNPVRKLRIEAKSGEVLLDRIVLARSEADLKALK